MKDGHNKQANVAITLGAAIGGTAGGAFGAQIGKMLAKSKMNKNFINKIKYSPMVFGGARRRKALMKKYQLVGSDIGATTGTTAGTLGALAKELRRVKRGYGGSRPGGGYSSGGGYKSYGGRGGFGGAKSPDVDDLLKNFGSKRKSDFKTKRDVKKAYREAARKHHPDIGGSEKKMKDINDAYSRVQESTWFKKLSHLRMISMRDEMSKIANAGSLTRRPEGVVSHQRKLVADPPLKQFQKTRKKMSRFKIQKEYTAPTTLVGADFRTRAKFIQSRGGDYRNPKTWDKTTRRMMNEWSKGLKASRRAKKRGEVAPKPVRNTIKAPVYSTSAQMTTGGSPRGPQMSMEVAPKANASFKYQSTPVASKTTQALKGKMSGGSA